MYLLAPFNLENFKKFFFLWTKFLGYKPLLLLSSTYWPFSLCKIVKKFFLQQIHSYEDASFWSQNGSFAQNKLFLEKNY